MKSYITILILISSLLSSLAQPNLNITIISEDVEILPLTEDIYIHISYMNTERYGRVAANGLVIIEGREAFLLDSPWTNEQTKSLVNYIEDSLGAKLSGFMPNHWHEDCMGGLGYLKEHHVASYANQMTIDMARREELPLPEIGFTDSTSLHIGKRIIKAYYLGAAHSTDNIVVWLEDEKLLFAGCTVKNTNARNLGNTADGDLEAYPKTLGKIIATFPDARIVVPGHGNSGGKEMLTHTLRLALDIQGK